MNVLGALKKSKSDKTIYFCEYADSGVKWEDICYLFDCCQVMFTVFERELLCVAFECDDDEDAELVKDKKIVGVTIAHNGSESTNIVLDDYRELNDYLSEI